MKKNDSMPKQQNKKENKVANKREQNDACISSAEREQARPKVNRSDFKDLPVAA